MAQIERPIVCEVVGENCKKEVQALCYHCSKNLCRTHLLRHAQLVEEKIQSELHALADKLNMILSRFNELSISDDILKTPFEQLEKFRADAHKQIDEIVEVKRQELNEKLRSYRETFQTNNQEQLSKLNSSKQILTSLIQEADASSSQIKDLQQSIDDAEKYLLNLRKPVMNVISNTPNWFINIQSQFLEHEKSTNNTVEEFRIIYVRLNGTIRNYYVKANINETMSDLIHNFVQQYTIVEELSQRQTNQIGTIDHLPKVDFILPTEIYNHRVHLQYAMNVKLSNILRKDIIAFYETHQSSQLSACPSILMPCLLQSRITRRNFGLPVYLSVPRKGCRGHDISEAIYNTIPNLFKSNDRIERDSYEVTIMRSVNNKSDPKKLDDVLDEEFDFSKINVTSIVSIDTKFIEKYERHCLDEFTF